MNLNVLFEEYRRMDELVFDIINTEKQKRLDQLKQQIEQYLVALKISYYSLIQHDLKNLQETLDGIAMALPKVSKNQALLDQHKNRINELIFAVVDDSRTTMTMTNNNTPILNTTTMTIHEKDSITRAKLLYWIGHYYFLNNCLLEAEQFLMKAIKLDPMISEAWNTLGNIYNINNEPLASKCCYESAISHQNYTNDSNVMMSYLYLSKILRSPHLSNHNEQLLANAHLSLECAKKALMASQKPNKTTIMPSNETAGATTYSTNAITDNSNNNAINNGELWFSLGNAYLTVFIREINQPIKKQNSAENYNTDLITGMNESLTKRDKEEEKEKSKDKENDQEKEKENESEKEKEKEKEKKDESTSTESMNKNTLGGLNLMKNEYLDKCLNAYKFAEEKCTINRHDKHPDLFFNRAIVYEHCCMYKEALEDLARSKAYGDDQVNATEKYNRLSHLLLKMDKCTRTHGNNTTTWKQQIKKCSIDIFKYFKNYRLLGCVNHLKEGNNDGYVIMFKLIQVISQLNEIPCHCLALDSSGTLFILTLYTVGNVNHQIISLAGQNAVQASNLISLCNPVMKNIKLNAWPNGNKNIDFKLLSFVNVQDIAIGGKKLQP